MPALNINFTDAEMEQLRQRARSAGVSLRTLVHDTVVSAADQSDLDALKAAAIARAVRRSGELLDLLAGQ